MKWRIRRARRDRKRLIIVRDAALIGQIPRCRSTSLVKPFRAQVSYLQKKLVET